MRHVRQQRGRDVERRSFDELSGAGLAGEQRLDVVSQRRVVAAGVRPAASREHHPRAPPPRRRSARPFASVRDSCGMSGSLTLQLRLAGQVSSRRSHTLASCHSRITVFADTPRTSAVSSLRQAAEEPHFHDLALTLVDGRERAQARRRVRRDRVRARSPAAARPAVRARPRHRRFRYWRARAKSTRIRRMRRADKAKKWQRPCHRTCRASISRR